MATTSASFFLPCAPESNSRSEPMVGAGVIAAAASGAGREEAAVAVCALSGRGDLS
eukprot:CAMPEP_0197934052 /NCGR_PEP_ID=MMETSP1439-20131203/111129_1 /TAXON_ID=66791 /ORGANISM="Gonyaulax spinifera, Strain CCMP409" /LENGTH=55 /DNA_ID=CAMNT_0043556925 /DNA_START=59 /DNA_END=223 /DNA_ORIENTATION=-